MKILKKIGIVLLIVILFVFGIGGVTVMTINSHVQKVESDSIVSQIRSDTATLTAAETRRLKKIDPQCAIVLGCGIQDNNTPSPMLRDRLLVGIMLYKKGLVKKLLLSGDNGTVSHNEVHVMLQYCLKAGIPGEDIFCDHAGFSTYDSMYRAKSVFRVKSAVVVTQTYHMYRSLYVADKLGIKVLGVSAAQRTYRGQSAREVREVLARNKDFFKVMFHMKPKYGGSAIPITGDGTISHGE
ncbi:MAG: SanA/YdcF family protein [Anaerovoracaceae bacterium]|jgi:SanA protein